MLRRNVQLEIAETRTHAGSISPLHITEFSTLQNNPQHTRVLVNDWLGTRLAEMIGLPETMIDRVRNLPSFAGVLAFDKWTCNADGRQVAFWKRPRQRKFNASYIDQGYCFNAGEWCFPDAPLRGVFGRNDVYAGITGWDSFEPWPSRIESFPESSLRPLVDQIPPEWYDSSVDELHRLLAQLLERRSRVRELIISFKNSSRNPFPNWRENAN